MSVHDIFTEYWAKKQDIEISIEEMKNDLGNMADGVVLYGAGSAGIAFLYYLRDVGIFPLCFADGDSKKWGSVCEGIPVINYKDIVGEYGEDVLVIVTINTDGKRYCKSFDEALRSGGHTGVHKNLHDAGCKNVIDYTYFRRCRKLFHGDRYNLPSCSDVYLMEKHETDLEKVYSLLADDYSKDVFERLIRFRMLDDSIKIPTEKQDKQYFEYEFYPKREDEIFVDCGAYNGISLKAFLEENNNKLKKYYGLEPDRENYKLLKSYINTLEPAIRKKIRIYNKAAYDKSGETCLYALHGPGSFIADIGKEIIQTETIDSIVENSNASYIKMNIEGSELKALKGAEKTIKKSHPKLAIAGYHKTKDLWEVPKLINQIIPSYRFYLRSYMNNLSFIYYAIEKPLG